MRLVSVLIAIFVIVVPNQNAFSQTDKWTLKECINYALENNIILKSNGLNIKSAAIVAQQAKFDYLPNIGAQAGYQLGMGRSLDPTTYEFVENEFVSSLNLSADISIVIWNGFKRYQTVKKTLSDLDISKYEELTLKNNVALNITKLFYNIQLNKNVVKSIESQLIISDANINRTKRLVEEGALADEQLQNLLMQQQSEQYSLLEAKGELQNAIIDLCSILNIHNYKDFDVVEGKEEINADLNINLIDVVNSAMSLPQIRMADQRIISTEYAVKIAKADFYPTLSFNFSYMSSFSTARRLPVLDSQGNPVVENGKLIDTNYPFFKQLDNSRTGLVGLTLSIPILNSFRPKSQVRLSKIALKQLQYEADNYKKQLREEIEKLYIDLQISKEKFSTSLAAVEHGKKIVEYAENKVSTGTLTMTDYIIAKNNVLIYETQANKAKYEYLLKLKILKFYYSHRIE